MAEVDTLGLQVPDDVRLKLAELDLELSEGKVENSDFFAHRCRFCCQNI